MASALLDKLMKNCPSKSTEIEKLSNESIRASFDKKAKIAERDAKISLQDILTDLSSDEESVRGHGLIMLARGIRKRCEMLLDQINSEPNIMRIVMSAFKFSQSYGLFKILMC
ncbi:unnamed protein product [Gongylonema pulchrum]|uniref:HEAT repeat domain-containing protein n=1 Tax=Gongylonema pulchrum TaxID=637853 RepID=A0A183ERQ8_9BILA|nr:unnamed protein product [Gongylonema pulchrum]